MHGNVPPISNLGGIPVIVSDLIPPGTWLLAPNFAQGLRHASLIIPKWNRYGERYVLPSMTTPLWTRHMLGVREAARDQRRRWRRRGRS